MNQWANNKLLIFTTSTWLLKRSFKVQQTTSKGKENVYVQMTYSVIVLFISYFFVKNKNKQKNYIGKVKSTMQVLNNFIFVLWHRRWQNKRKKKSSLVDLCYTFITRLSFWILFRSRSPCFMVAWYCQFLWSGLLVSTTPPTLSILQFSLPAAMNLESSLSINSSLTPNALAMYCNVRLRYDSSNCV